MCNLGSINLGRLVRNGAFDFARLGQIVRVAVPFLDRVIDRNYYPTPRTAASNARWRPVGLGVMGLQDVFFQLGLAFDGDEARQLSQRIAEEIYFHALWTSTELAETSGAHETFAETHAAQGRLQFDLWGAAPSDPERWQPLRDRIARFGLRNSLLVAVAPTATIASIAGCYECIEPQVSNLFKRETLSGEFLQVNTYLVRELQRLGLWDEAVRSRIKAADGSVQDIDQIPPEVKAVFRTAWEIPMRSLIDMAAERGAFIDQSQSLNLFVAAPTIGKLSSMYLHAWKQGLKTTYYLRSRPATRIAAATVPGAEAPVVPIHAGPPPTPTPTPAPTPTRWPAPWKTPRPARYVTDGARRKRDPRVPGADPWRPYPWRPCRRPSGRAHMSAPARRDGRCLTPASTSRSVRCATRSFMTATERLSATRGLWRRSTSPTTWSTSTAGSCPRNNDLVKRLVAFFATGDSIVANNLVLNLYRHINAPEARLYLSRQLFEEAVHVQFYLTLLDTYLADENEQAEAFAAVEHIPSIRAKAQFCFRWIDSLATVERVESQDDRRAFLLNLVCFAACIEGLFFFAAFAYVYFLRSKGLLNGLASGTNWVFRDESAHMSFAFDVIDTVRAEEPELFDTTFAEQVTAMLAEAVEAETGFAEDILAEGVPGLSVADTRRYLEYVADQRLVRLGLPKRFGASNPFGFMELQDVSELANFFERTVSAYQVGVTGAVAFDEEF